jgi:protein tyrosine/serine phosphatase
VSLDLDWPDCLNARDVGGMPTTDGRAVSNAALIRADSLDRLTEAGVAAFRAADVSRVVDLRRPVEAATRPHPFRDEAIYRNIPVQNPADPDHQWLTLAEIYLAMLDLRPTFFAAAVAAIADAPPGAVVVHCAGGKDRTGIVTAMALSVAGVDDETIAADYALSESRLAADNKAHLAAITDPAVREVMRRLQPTPASNMLTVLDRLNSKYDGAAGFLRTAGMSDAQLTALRKRLVR